MINVGSHLKKLDILIPMSSRGWDWLEKQNLVSIPHKYSKLSFLVCSCMYHFDTLKSLSTHCGTVLGTRQVMSASEQMHGTQDATPGAIPKDAFV